MERAGINPLALQSYEQAPMHYLSPLNVYNLCIAYKQAPIQSVCITDKQAPTQTLCITYALCMHYRCPLNVSPIHRL